MKKKRNFPRKKNINRKEIGKEIEKKMLLCYECNKLGYLRVKCPQPLKEHKRKKKALVVAWDDSEESSSDDEYKESANICLMAHEDEVHSNSYRDFDIDELFNAYNKLMIEYKKLYKKRKETNSLNKKINNQLEELAKEKDSLALDNETLRNEKVSLDDHIRT